MSIGASNYTKNLLYQSFIKLTETKSIEEITIQNILDDCNIARSTFYRYFRDKYELMSSYCFDQIALFQEHYKVTNTNAYDMQSKVLLDSVQFIYNNQKYFSCITKYSGQNSLLEAFISHGKSYYRNLLDASISQELCSAIDYHSYGESNLIVDWIEHGYHMKPEEFCVLLQSFMPKILEDTLRKLQW